MCLRNLYLDIICIYVSVSMLHRLILIDNFYMQPTFLTLPLIPYFEAKTVTKRKNILSPLLGPHTKFHILNKITSISNHFLHPFQTTLLFCKAIILYIYHQVNINLNVNILTPYNLKTINERREKI